MKLGDAQEVHRRSQTFTTHRPSQIFHPKRQAYVNLHLFQGAQDYKNIGSTETMSALQNGVAPLSSPSARPWEPIVQSCKETLQKIQGKCNGGSQLILHRSKWQCLARCYAAVIDALQLRLQCLLSGGDDLSYQNLIGPLKLLYHAMQEALRNMENCTKPPVGSLNAHEWRVCKALQLGISTDVVDLHLHDFMWAYATLQLVLLHKDKLDCDVISLEEQAGMLEEEQRLLYGIWADSVADANHLSDPNLLDQIIAPGDEEEEGSRSHLAARFICERLAHAEGAESLSMTRGSKDLPPFLWVSKESFNIGARLDVIGKGGYGFVHEAQFHGIGRFAIKEFLYVQCIEVFGREAAIQARLRHPNVMHLVCCLKDPAQGNRCSLVMERMQQDLNILMKEMKCERAKDHPPFTLVEAVDLMLQIAKGMQYLHSLNIVHRDLKSSNILVSFTSAHSPAGAPRVKIADFGTSKGKPHADSNFTTSQIGTTQWKAPEVSNGNYTNKADVYSFGMVCYEILTGKNPFPNTTNLQMKVLEGKRPILPSYCPPALASYIERCWHGNPAARPSFNQICRVLRFLKACIFLSIQPAASTEPYQQCLEHPLSSDMCTSIDSMLQPFESRLVVRLQGPAPLSVPLEMFCCYLLIQKATRYKRPTMGSIARIVTTFLINISKYVKQTPPQAQRPVLDGPMGTTARQFSHDELVKITNGFRNKIEACGAKKIYIGKLADGQTEVVVRSCEQGEVIESPSPQAHECHLGAELEVVLQLQHQHIVLLLGWCVHPPQLLLVYKYMPNGDLATNLFGNSTSTLSFDRRCMIIEQVASALDYLHSGLHRDSIIIHRDVKTSNIMLDSKWNSRLGGFNYACALENSDSFKSDTAMVGTCGYIAPESFKQFITSTKSDVFSFGVVILTVVCGKEAVKHTSACTLEFLTDMVWDLYLQHRLKDAADARFNLQANCEIRHIERMLTLGLSCTNALPDTRPTMRTVLSVLSERLEPPQPHEQRQL